MFIVTKLFCYENKTEIVSVVDERLDIDRLLASEALLNSALKDDEKSIKTISADRFEVYEKGYFGNILKYVYEIHEIIDESDEDKKD